MQLLLKKFGQHRFLEYLCKILNHTRIINEVHQYTSDNRRMQLVDILL